MYLFAFLLILHIIGDFYLQWNKLAKSKEAIFNAVASEGDEGSGKGASGFGSLLLHVIIYLIPFLALIMLNESPELKLIAALLIIAISHFFIDLITLLLKQVIKRTYAFMLDQALHIAVLLIVLNAPNLRFHIPHWLVSYIVPFLVLAIIIKPSSILINTIFQDLFNDEDSNVFGVASLVGIFERLIIISLLVLNSIPTIGIIIAAKTLVRYDQIKTDSDFRGKYLVGTLLSIAIPVLCFAFLKLAVLALSGRFIRDIFGFA